MDITDQLEQARELARQNADLRSERENLRDQLDIAGSYINELQNIIAAYEQYDQ